jgi:hypothetical protein
MPGKVLSILTRPPKVIRANIVHSLRRSYAETSGSLTVKISSPRRKKLSVPTMP